MRKFMRIVLALIIVLIASSLAVQADRGRHGGHRHSHGGGRVGIGVIVGPGFWGPGWWWPYPHYPYYPPSVIVERPAEIYLQPPTQADEDRYWYYCKDKGAEGYYPTIKRCPGGWMKVVPPAPQPEGEE